MSKMEFFENCRSEKRWIGFGIHVILNKLNLNFFQFFLEFFKILCGSTQGSEILLSFFVPSYFF